jgi:signal transduction histidine kinase
MKMPLHILHLEDDPDEVGLVRIQLKSEGISCSITHVRNESDFTQALERGGVDLVIADQAVPGFEGLSALKMTRAKWPDLPFILMSGTVGEEFAIESLKSGATDYVLKDHRTRLVPAVRRAMREVEERVERRKLEEQFILAQKMEAVGQLSSGIAHDFNNILGIIIGNNDYIRGKLGGDDPLLKNAEEIQHAAERAAAVTRQLLVFSSNQVVQPVVRDLNEVIQGMDKMLSRLLTEHIELTIVLGKQLGRIKADSGYLGQLLMNLVINARDAMPDGGSLTIETSNAQFDKKLAPPLPNATADRYVVLSVRDTGIGMTDEVKARLFEAFFTTKPKGKGTGLGLATCQTIAKQSNAHIEVESELGKGTIFKVYFPRVDQPLHMTSRHLLSMAPPRGTETLLIVEDEAALRRMTSMALENQGYTVLQAATGQEGLQVADKHKGPPIALVITDVIMPEMGGKVMAEWLKASYPEIKVLFTSGYTDATIVQHGVLDPAVAFIPKPYTLATLAAKIREVLDGQQ